MNSQNELNTIVDKAYRKGFLDCLQAYAYQSGDQWKVGNNGITLKEATRNLDDSHYFNPASAHKVVDAYLDALTKKLNASRVAKGIELIKNQFSGTKITDFDPNSESRKLFNQKGQEAIKLLNARLETETNEKEIASIKHRISISERVLAGKITLRQAIVEAL